MEGRGGVGLGVDAFLQHAYPYVATLILGDGGDLGQRQVYVAAEEGVVGELACGGVEDAGALAVAAYHNLVVAAAVEFAHLLACGRLNGDEGVAREPEDTILAGAHVDVALLVLADAEYLLAKGSFLEIAGQHMVVGPNQQAFFLGDYP